MGGKSRRRGSQKAASKRKSSAVIIAIAAIVVAVGAGVFILATMRSAPGDQGKVSATNSLAVASEKRAQRVTHQVVNSYPHDPTSFTQGLLWHDGGFYESTGQYGESKLRRVEFPSGKVLKEIKLSPEFFGEGLSLAGGRLIQLTWKSHRGFVYDRSTFRLLEEFSYDTEGWGLTFDGKNLIMSDGSSDLFYLDPTTFRPIKRIPVRMNGQPVLELNELEFIEGEIWANVWRTDLIVRIDPATGLVTSFLDLKGIQTPDRAGPDAVLNGIAYDTELKRVFVTGKLWPRIFEIKITP